MDNVTSLVIGDPHFKAKNLKEGREFVDKVVAKADKYKPTFIVCLGDTLDTHEIGRSPPYNLALEFIRKMSDIAPFYLIIGNHDLINNQQFLTDSHFFNACKTWHNVHIVDYPTWAQYGECSFAFCPYVPLGRFTEAMDELTKEGEAWDLADCIFAHQEFLGCKMGAIESINGDEWDENYPPVISGHIHDEQNVFPNIYYPGSSIQHAFGESPNKKIWYVTFNQLEDPPYFNITKINLGMKGKKIIYKNIEEVEKFDFTLSNKYHIKLCLTGTSEQFKVFRRGNFYSRLVKAGVKIAYTAVKINKEDLAMRTREQTSYRGMLRELVKKKSDEVRAVYKELLEEKLEDEEKREESDKDEEEREEELEDEDEDEEELEDEEEESDEDEEELEDEEESDEDEEELEDEEEESDEDEEEESDEDEEWREELYRDEMSACEFELVFEEDD